MKEIRFFLCLLLLVLLAFGTGSLTSTAAASKEEHYALSSFRDADLSGSPFKGPPDASVVIVVFSDFQ